MKIKLFILLLIIFLSACEKNVPGWKFDVALKLCNNKISYYSPHWLKPDVVVCKGPGYYEIYGTMKAR